MSATVPFLSDAVQFPGSGADDVVYLPLLHPYDGNSNKMDTNTAAPGRFYPIYSKRLPMRYEDLVAGVEELNGVLYTSWNEGLQTKWKGKWGHLFQISFISLMSFMLLEFATYSQLFCPSNTAPGFIAVLSIPMIVICWCALIVFSICAMCRGEASTIQIALEQDLIFNDKAPAALMLQEKLVELGQRYNVTFDLLSATHVVDETEGGRRFTTFQDAWQKKIDFETERNVFYSDPGVGSGYIAHCVTLRPKQPPFAPPPLPPPLWCADADAASRVTIVSDNRDKTTYVRFSSDCADPAVTQCMDDINAHLQMSGKQMRLVLAVAVLWLGGFYLIYSGTLLRVLGIGCNDSNDSDMWLLYIGFVFGWLAFGWKSVTLAKQMLNEETFLTSIVSEINKRNAETDLEINVGVEVSSRLMCGQKFTHMHLFPHLVLYYFRTQV